MLTDYQQRIFEENARVRQENLERARLSAMSQRDVAQSASQQPQGGAGGIGIPGGAIAAILKGIGGGASGAGAGAGAAGAAGTAGSGAAAGASGASGAAGAAGAGAGSWIGAAGPYAAIAAAAIAQHMWAKNKGYHDNRDALEGTALYKDVKNYYQDKGNRVWDGLGDSMALGALLGAPKEWGSLERWKDATTDAVKSPFKMIKKLFK